jgi:hypothetical protein
MEDGQCGVINNILCLYADVKVSEIIQLWTRRIFDIVKQTHTGITICNPAKRTPTESTQHSMSKVETLLAQILSDKKWTWNKILADAKHMCGSSVDKTSNFDIDLDPKKVAAHFKVSLLVPCI